MNLLKRAKHYARTAVRIVKSTRQRKLLIRQKLVEHSDKMAPGLYIIGFRTAHRLFSPMPPTLKASKTSRLSPQLYPIVSRLVYTFDSRFPPNFHYIPKTSPHASDGDTTLFVSALKNAKTFNLKKQTVTTYFEDKEPILHLERAYKALSPALPIPPQKINHDQLSIEEPFIQGLPFSSAPIHKQIESYRQLLNALANHIEKSEHTYLTPDQAQSLIDTVLARNDLPQSLRDEVQQNISVISSILTTSPLVPSHRDLHADNIIINGTSPSIIDLELFNRMPYFYDLLLLPVTEAYKNRPQLLDKLIGGIFEREWSPLVLASATSNNNFQRIYLLAFIICHFSSDIYRPEAISKFWHALTYSNSLQPSLSQKNHHVSSIN